MFDKFHKNGERAPEFAGSQISEKKLCETCPEHLTLIGEFTRNTALNMMQLLKEDGELTHGLNILLTGTEYTTGEIRQVEKQIKRLDDSILMTNHSIGAVSESLTVSSKVIEDTRKGYLKMSHGMDDVSSVFEDFYELFEQLNAHYKEIQGFANMITNVANQTRLLSLNASIEAARVGNAGTGFAVVANEIKKLSDESQKNATDIIGSLQRMTETINRLNRKSTEGNKVVLETKKMVLTSENFIDGIVEAENNVREKVDDVKNSQGTNVEAIKKITENLENVARRSDQDNIELNTVVAGINRKAGYYSYILNHLDQVRLITEKKDV